MADEPEFIRLDGREFSSVDQKLTAAQDDYITVVLNDCGAAPILREIGAGNKTEELATRLLHTILRSGMTSQLLAGLLTEKGTKWRRAEADRNAALFADITDTDEKVRMRQVLVALVIGFFRFGGTSSKTSPKFSHPTEKVPVTSNGEAGTSDNSPALSVQ